MELNISNGVCCEGVSGFGDQSSLQMSKNSTIPLVPKNPTAIYLRVSTNDQDPQNQLKQCQELAAKLGLDVIKIYEESASAWSIASKRIQYNKMMEDARNRLFKHIIAWDIDRLHRNAKRFIEMIQGYQRIGIKFHTVNQQYLETLNELPIPFNHMMTDFLLHWEGWRAQDESERRSRRVKEAYKNRSKKWGRPKLSYYKRVKVRELYSNGMSMSRISSMMKIGKGTVHKIIRENLQKQEVEISGSQEGVQN